MSDYADIDREFQAYQDRIADLEARIEELENALRGAEQDWVAGEIKLLERIKEMLDAPHNYRRKHIMDEIDLAIAVLDQPKENAAGWPIEPRAPETNKCE